MARGGDTMVKVNEADGLVVGHDIQDEAAGAREGQIQAVPDQEPLSKVAVYVSGNLADIIRGVGREKGLPHVIVGGASDVHPMRVRITVLHINGAHPRFLEENDIKGETLQQTLYPSGTTVSVHRGNANGVFRH